MFHSIPPILIIERPTVNKNKQAKQRAQIRVHSKQPHIITIMNDNRKMDGTIERTANAPTTP